MNGKPCTNADLVGASYNSLYDIPRGCSIVKRGDAFVVCACPLKRLECVSWAIGASIISLGTLLMLGIAILHTLSVLGIDLSPLSLKGPATITVTDVIVVAGFFLMSLIGTAIPAIISFMYWRGTIEIPVVEGHPMTEVRYRIGMIVWRRSFDFRSLSSVCIKQTAYTSNDIPLDGIVLEFDHGGPDSIIFGVFLSDAQREWVCFILRLVATKSNANVSLFGAAGM